MQLRIGILAGFLAAVVLPNSANAADPGAGAKQQSPFDAAVERLRSTRAAPPIFFGEPAPAGAYPFQVALISSAAEKGQEFDAQYCGGTLIDKQWVLTAAQCAITYDEEGNTVPLSPGDVDVYVGSQDFTGGERIKAGKVVVHPKYDSTTSDFDVALIQLARSPKENTKIGLIEPVTPADEATYAAPGKGVTVIGWGQTEEGEYPHELREAGVDVQDAKACNSGIIKARLNDYQAYLDEIKQGVQVSDDAMSQVRDIIADNTGTVVTDNMICAGKESGADVCALDNGGPLFAKTADGKFVEVGIVSWNQVCGGGGEGLYTVYARVAKVGDWIKETVGTPGSADESVAPAE
jgi:secreted trypsin-like serine protease